MKGIVIRKPDRDIEARAKRAGVEITVCDGWDIPFELTLFAGAGMAVPWDLLEAGFHFVERWDAAAPLFRYGVLAKDLGGPADRERTKALTIDLRIPVYEPRLLFVRTSNNGEKLVETWRDECGDGDEKLAFLRALCLVKPKFLPLPASWQSRYGTPLAPLGREVGQRPQLVHVEVAPGRFVQCKPEEVELYKERFRQMLNPRRNVRD